MSDNYMFANDDPLESLRIPPHSIPAEQAVLGGLMLDNQTWDSVADKVQEVDFYRRDHRLIFRVIAQLAEKQSPFDIITISEALAGELEDTGGLAYLGWLAKNTPSAANIVTYANIVRDRSVLRQLIHVGTTIADSAFNPEGRETAELLESAEREVFKIAEQRQRGQGGFIPIKALLAKAVDRIETLFEQDGNITGAATGFSDFDQLTSGLQPADLIIVAGRPSMGKCFGKGTPILMYSGAVKAVEDIQVGDELMGDDSTPRRVLSLARGREAMYWVRQNKAMAYRVNQAHILSLKRSRNDGKHKNGDVLNVPLTDYLAASAKFRSNYKGYKVAVEFAEQALPFCPYFLGLWLGDGVSASVDIATTDAEVVAYLRDYAAQLNLQLTEKFAKDKDGNDSDENPQQRGNHQNQFSLQKILREQGLLNNKHIPQAFLLNSRANRLKLLAGLIDSDGHYAGRYKMYEITQKNAALAAQIKFLCDSLGYRTSLIQKQASIKARDFQTTVHRVRFTGDVDAIPVRVARKKAAAWASNRTWQQTGVSVEYDGVDDYYGFVCDGNRLFLLEDMTVVHNTTIAMNMAENIAIKSDKAVAVFSMEMPGDALAMRMMSSLGRIDQHKVRTGKLEDDEWPRLTSAINLLAETKLFIDDTPALSPTEVRSRARRLTREHGQLGLIVLDYLQLMQSPSSGENRVQQISDISRGLKALAKELNVPVIALSQLNRNLEQRPNKRPVMSDLRECVTGDTLVLLADGRRLPISELVGQTPEVVSVSPQGQLQTAATDLVWSVGRKEIVKISLASGRTIRCTKEHRLRGLSDWQRAGQLQPGDKLHTLADNALVWDRVVAVEPAGEEEVFDLTVPGNACWLADGIVSHNSGAIEQDADLIVFVYRDEVYNEDSPDKGIAEIIIGKQRNGPLGTVRLTFLGQYTRFENFSGQSYSAEDYE
ncbi:replicative DNA helicase [Methylovulum psychrotolerans]|nr:replicative DNA helicase [Methylovulum psychrotolerans]